MKTPYSVILFLLFAGFIVAEISPENKGGGISRPTEQEKTDFWHTFEHLATQSEAASSASESHTISEKTRCLTEIENYFDEKRLPSKEDSLLWWKTNGYKFNFLTSVAKKYLSIPATEVDSERVFSTAGNVVTKRRESLTQEHVKELVFLHEN